MWENLKEGNDELELNLELSIGGNYGKKIEKNPFGEISRNNFCCDKNDEFGNGFLDLNKRKEIQALRRKEARRKRDDKLFLEAQKFQIRVQDRENREKEEGLVDLRRKGEKYGEDLNLSLFSHNGNVVPVEGEGVYKNENGNGSLSMDYNSGFNNVKIEQGKWGAVSSLNGYLERSSSAVSDYQGTFRKGASISDAGSHSSDLSSQQDKNHPKRDHLIEQVKSNGSSSATESQKVSQLSEDSNQTKTKRPTSVDPVSRQMKERSSDVNKKWPPRPSNQNQVTQPMPCVSTKGNGPNGKTIMGFLYKYTKSEINIMCVCHGTSFSPAEFVEHAGCVDIENPLRHITIVPPA